MITLKTFVGAENTAEDDSTLYKKAIENGIIEGCNFTKSGDNQINISDGYICFRGRNIQVVSESHLATLATSGTKQGALYLNLDIENHTKPIELISEIGKTSFTENQLLLATYTATALTISDLTVVCDRILDARKNKIQVVEKFPPNQNDDITKGYLIGDNWTVPNIIFHNLIKNGDDVKVADWIVKPSNSLKKWSRGFKFTVNEPMGSAIQNTNIDVIAGHTYFAKFNRKISLDGEYLELIIKAGNTEIFKKTVENTSDLNALKVFGTFVAPQNASGKLSYEIILGNYIIGEDTHPIAGDTYIEEITLIDLTEDMTDLYKFNQAECSDYFFNKTFKTLLYEKSGTYVCLNNAENNASWEKPLTKSVMTVSANGHNIPLSKEGTIDCNYVLSSTGNSLTQDTAGIVIGAGVSKVKVSCNFWINAEGENRVWVTLNHINFEKGTVFDKIGDVISTDRSGYVTGSISPVLVDVMQGDCFFLTYENAVSGLALNKFSESAHATNLTVEVIE